MQFKIPFTNLFIQSDVRPMADKRPYAATTRTIGDPEKDNIGQRLGFNSFYTAYRFQSDIHGCIREWREGVGATGFSFYDPTDSEADVDPIDAGDITNILSYDRTFRQLKSRTLRDLGVCGNAFWAFVRSAGNNQILGMQPIDPRTMSIVSTKHGEIVKYIQRVRNNEVVIFEPDEIVHFKLEEDPNNEVFGMSPIEPIIWEVKTDMASSVSNYYFFENSAVPAVQYILEDGLKKEQQDQAIEMIRNNYKGAKNRNKSAVLAGVKEIKEISMTNKDMEFIEGRKFNTDKICAAYGVPKFLLGYTDKVNNNNGQELLKKFYKGTIEPLEEMIAEVINEQIIGRTELAGLVAFKFNPQTFNEQADIEERALKELEKGAITLRQYKKKTGQEITDEDEQEDNIDRHIIHSGSSAMLLDDVGVMVQPTEGIDNSGQSE